MTSAVTLVVASHLWTRPYLLDRWASDQEWRDFAYKTLLRLPPGTALFEEVAFRGVVEGVWRLDGATEREAALAAAISCALWHLIPAADALAGNPADTRLASQWWRAAAAVLFGAALTGFASLGFSWTRRRSGSLVAPWSTHTAFSITGYLAGVVAWRRSTRSQVGVGSALTRS